MVKQVRLDPIAQVAEVATNGNLLSILIREDLNVLKECGGRGLCATCHVYVTQGMGSLSPIAKREQRTLEVITSCRPESRLACQSRVLGEGVVVELPVGMYINAYSDIESLVGRRAEQDLLHPVTGQVLVQSGKLITRTVLLSVKNLDFDIQNALSSSNSSLN
jgi:ferredoxin